MYYEEKMIDGVLHYRTSPRDAWTPCTLKEASEKAVKRYQELNAALDRLDKLSRMYEDLVRDYEEVSRGYLKLDAVASVYYNALLDIQNYRPHKDAAKNMREIARKARQLSTEYSND